MLIIPHLCLSVGKCVVLQSNPAHWLLFPGGVNFIYKFAGAL